MLEKTELYAVIFDDYGQVLLSEFHDGTQWCIPGGAPQDLGPLSIQELVKEQTGLNVSVNCEISATPKCPEHQPIGVWLCRIESGSLQPTKKFRSHGWVCKTTINDYSTQSNLPTSRALYDGLTIGYWIQLECEIITSALNNEYEFTITPDGKSIEVKGVLFARRTSGKNQYL